VSYVLNGAPNQSISLETRQRVLEAAEHLGYTPYAPARALRSGRSDVILFLTPEWPIGPTIAKLVEDLTLALAEAGLTLVLHAHPRLARPLGDLWKAITPAAVINHQALDEAEVQTARRAGIPVVAPAFQLGDGGTFVDFQQEIGRRQAEHMAATGHRRLGFALPDDDRLSAFAQPRLEGVRQVCARLDLDEPVTQTIALQAASAVQAIKNWRRRQHRVTAICSYNDEVALAVLAGMRIRGMTAPNDLAVVGVDNIPAGALAVPALTTIATGMSALGRYLATAVVNALEDKPMPPGPGEEMIRLIRRESA
jgi:DNA-binding LacI/PurR family transcriptional regulator